jgi:hypothetical protein
MAGLLEAGAAEVQLAQELLLAKYSGRENELDVAWSRCSIATVNWSTRTGSRRSWFEFCFTLPELDLEGGFEGMS